MTAGSAGALAGIDLDADADVHVAGIDVGSTVDQVVADGATIVRLELPADLGISAGTSGIGVSPGPTAGSDAAVSGNGRVATWSAAPTAQAVERALPAAAAGAGFLALLWLLAEPLRWGAAGLAMPLYSRISRSELLDSGTRNRIYAFVQGRPGVAIKEIEAATGLGWGTVVYHLKRLEDARMLVSKRDGNYRRFFVNGEHAAAKDGIMALRHDMAKAIAGFIVAEPGCNQKDVCEALGIGPSLAHKHVAKLEGAGLVTKARDWRSVVYRPSDELHALLAGDAVDSRAAPAVALAASA